ncbi:MAG: nucleotidyltransferase domain-containing protein [Chloroflexi bacterium]|nr:nucleotidyltransferase domain-containing protein [Chloroflexota bacterium]
MSQAQAKPAKRNKRARVIAETKIKYRVARAPKPPDPIIATELPRAVERIANALHPEKIILFGSHAYGTPTYDSDVDLLVIWDTDASRRERHWTVAQHLIPRVFALDLLVRTPTEIQSAMAKGDFFIDEIVTKGKVLYERSR